MKKRNSTVLLETLFSTMVFGGIGIATIGFYDGMPLGLIVGVVVGLLVSILYQLNKLINIVQKDNRTES